MDIRVLSKKKFEDSTQTTLHISNKDKSDVDIDDIRAIRAILIQDPNLLFFDPNFFSFKNKGFGSKIRKNKISLFLNSLVKPLFLKKVSLSQK